ncbi:MULTISPECIES: type II secretion system protein [Ralstonia]|uniref:Type II secretion system protein n=1 Tax=Ralstonia holmesii TaxID=3058602 RepID=A0ABC8QAE7_9RALS|nr:MULTISPECIES: type II secretion system protein [unclassified Ralstonia]CAJ0787286.1 hypothetical protein LMG18096_01942 [Ralstonia sp. LMG 32967]CAJ0808121.1 hypothetical protein LMG18093_00446 [Ralstonia sp. LMG 32967]
MPAHNHVIRQHGAILLESLVALAVLSLCAAGTLSALEQMEATSQSLRQLLTDVRTQNDRVESASGR